MGEIVTKQRETPQELLCVIVDIVKHIREGLWERESGPQVENFCRTKAPFIQTSNAEKNDSHSMYKPKTPDNHPVK